MFPAIIGTVLKATVFGGKGGIKAIGGGIGGAITGAVLPALQGGCDVESIMTSLWMAAGGWLIGHTATWLSPKNKEA